MNPPPAHSPLPWKYLNTHEDGYHFIDADGEIVIGGSCYSDITIDKKDAEFLCAAVNSHAPLRELVGELADCLQEAMEGFADAENKVTPWFKRWSKVLAKAQAEVK